MERFISKVNISLGDVVLRFQSELPLEITDNISAFRIETERADRIVNVKIMDEMINLPPNPCGDDLLLNYYSDGSLQYAVTKPGLLNPLSVVTYTSDFSETTVYVNEREHPGVVRTVEKILQVFPLRQLLMQFHSMVLHASQIAVAGKGILFTAPSGTGKSTQAQLWNMYENAEIICNDRTLLRMRGADVNTYGFPIDGSNPVCSNTRLNLGAIVVLQQSNENHIRRLRVFEAMKYLMEQSVADSWNPVDLHLLGLQWMDVASKYPVYLLKCRPDRDAVVCLKEQLKREGVI